MGILRRVETLVVLIGGMALGVLCTLHDNTSTAQEKAEKRAIIAQRVGEVNAWDLWSYPHMLPPLSREVRHYLYEVLKNKLDDLHPEFERDYLFEQFGERGKPKQERNKIWCFRQALHAAVKTYPGCPPNPSRFPELEGLVDDLNIPAEGGGRYYLDSVIYAPNDVADFAKKGDRIYVVKVMAPRIGINWLWVNARTGEVAALFPVSKPDILLPGTRVLLEPPKKN